MDDSNHNFNKLEEIRKEYKRSSIVMTGLVLIVVFQGVFGYWSIRQNRERANDIQQQRLDTLIVICREQNLSNRSTIKVLDDRVAELSKDASPEAKLAIRQTRDYTKSLVDALAPYKPNCMEEAQRLLAPSTEVER